jgi:hypothetical protein
MELQQFYRRTIVKYERYPNSFRWRVGFNQEFPAPERLVKIVHDEGNVWNGPDDLGHRTVGLEAHPLNPEWAGLKTADMHAEMIEVFLFGMWGRARYPNVVVPPA